MKYAIISSLMPDIIQDELIDENRNILGYNPRLQTRAGKNQIRFRSIETGKIRVLTLEPEDKVAIPLDPKMSQELEDFIKAYCSQVEPIEDHILYKGFTYKEPLSIKIPEEFEGVEEWEEFPYIVCWKSEKHKAILTYCEGDIHLSVHKKDETYQREVIEADEFYKER